MTLKKLEWWDRFKVADDSTDIRGWTLDDRQGHRLGHIDDLIYDDRTCQVRYAVTDVATRKVLIPVGKLALDEDRRHAVATDLTALDLDKVQGYVDDRDITEADERRYHADYAPPTAAGEPLDYRREAFTPSHPRLRRIEERLRAGHGLREPSFAASEPTFEEQNIQPPLNRPGDDTLK